MKANEIAAYLDFIRPSNTGVVSEESGFCDACGALTNFRYTEVINKKLAADWKLSEIERKNFSRRESMYCAFCGCSYRLRALARAITLCTTNSTEYISLESVIAGGKLNSLKVAEINSCGVLHEILKGIPGLIYSEYMPVNKAVPHQDLMALSYKDNSMDIVLTSDTLEHVPDPKKAFSEIFRILKPGGKHIFTVPALLNRKTKIRTVIKDNNILNLESASFHGSGEDDYLVWSEFGADIVNMIEDAGFIVQILYQNNLDLAEPTCVFVAHKPPRKQSGLLHIEGRYGQNLSIENVAKKLTNDFEVISYDIKIDVHVQIEKTRVLSDKLELTLQHANNLESIVAAYEQEISSLRQKITNQKTYIDSVNDKIQKFNNSAVGRTYRIAKKFKPKAKSD